MRWPRSVFADSLEELAHEAELHFKPGTTYSIYSIREEGGDEDRVTYRADAHPEPAPGHHRTRSRAGSATRDGRTRVGRNIGHDAGPGTSGPTGTSGVGPGSGTEVITGRIAEPGDGPSRSGRTERAERAAQRVPSDASDRQAEPERPDGPDGRGRPGWAPAAIPGAALGTGPGLSAAYGLLMDPDAPGSSRTPEEAGPRAAGNAGPRAAWKASEAGRQGGEGAGVVGVFATADPRLHEMLDHVSPAPTEGTGLILDEAVDTGDLDPDAPLDERGRRRVRLVFAGLLDDAVEAAERSGHHRWTAAGVLNGGRPGAPVVCYGLGDGSDVARLAQGLHRYAPLHLVLAVDASRKHADTQAWVRQVESVMEPASVLAVPRTVTGTPGTVRDLGYRMHTPSETAEHLHR